MAGETRKGKQGAGCRRPRVGKRDTNWGVDEYELKTRRCRSVERKRKRDGEKNDGDGQRECWGKQAQDSLAWQGRVSTNGQGGWANSRQVAGWQADKAVEKGTDKGDAGLPDGELQNAGMHREKEEREGERTLVRRASRLPVACSGSGGKPDWRGLQCFHADEEEKKRKKENKKMGGR